MIDISSLMTSEIIDKHRRYIINKSGVLERLNSLKLCWRDKLYLVDIKSFNLQKDKSITRDVLEADLIYLTEFFIEETKALKKDPLNQNNIFIASPSVLHGKIVYMESEYKISIEYIDWECKCCSKPVINAINSAFGYEKFSKLTLSTQYKSMLKSLETPQGKIYSDINSKCKEDEYADEIEFIKK